MDTAIKLVRESIEAEANIENMNEYNQIKLKGKVEMNLTGIKLMLIRHNRINFLDLKVRKTKFPKFLSSSKMVLDRFI